MTNPTPTLNENATEPAKLGMSPYLLARLAAPFSLSEVKFRPGATNGQRALALAYVDARVIMDRLDGVLGPANWRDEFVRLGNDAVECRLSIRVAGEWITKADVGAESEQKDEHDRTKAAYSDALKRAAVKWGIGRYLYRLPQSWCEYDPQKRQIVKPPQLPAWAVPQGASIAKAEAQELYALIEEAKVPMEKFLAAYHIKAVGDLPADKLADARRRLEVACRQLPAKTPTQTDGGAK